MTNRDAYVKSLRDIANDIQGNVRASLADGWVLRLEKIASALESAPSLTLAEVKNGTGFKRGVKFLAETERWSCYRCGAGTEHCECPDEMEPDGVR